MDRRAGFRGQQTWVFWQIDGKRCSAVYLFVFLFLFLLGFLLFRGLLHFLRAFPREAGAHEPPQPVQARITADAQRKRFGAA